VQANPRKFGFLVCSKEREGTGSGPTQGNLGFLVCSKEREGTGAGQPKEIWGFQCSQRQERAQAQANPRKFGVSNMLEGKRGTCTC
jgi:hypothetical protein